MSDYNLGTDLPQIMIGELWNGLRQVLKFKVEKFKSYLNLMKKTFFQGKAGFPNYYNNNKHNVDKIHFYC